MIWSKATPYLMGPGASNFFSQYIEDFLSTQCKTGGLIRHIIGILEGANLHPPIRICLWMLRDSR